MLVALSPPHAGPILLGVSRFTPLKARSKPIGVFSPWAPVLRFTVQYDIETLARATKRKGTPIPREATKSQ